MVNVPQPHRDRCYHHLGYHSGAGIPLGDLARLEEALNDIKSDYHFQKLLEQLDRCDRAEKSSELGGEQGLRYQNREIYGGDINRSILRESSKDHGIWWEAYLRESDKLAHMLWVANYQRESSLRYRFERSGGAFINSIPGPADTVAVSRIEGVYRYGGSFGF